jgi:adenylate cyclase
MGQDEEATIRALSNHRKIIDRLIAQHWGRFVNSAGDSVLAEFASVVNAVECAVDIQRTIKTENAEVPAERRMEFRIGVNLGDVVVEGEQIYGDGVNVAARLESLADPGGICISGKVREEILNKLELAYANLGEQAVKNIAHPVHAWRVLLDGTAASLRTSRRRWYWRGGALSMTGLAIVIGTIVLVQHVSFKPPHTSASIPPQGKSRNLHPNPLPQNSGRGLERPTLPSIPSIAVMPFTNLSGDAAQDYFSDGMTDDLVTDLSRLPGLFVIDRSSTFTYKGKAVGAHEVGSELGVKYVLEGSARKAGDRVRINVQLVDASTGNEIWAQRYDRQMSDIFGLQDEIVRSLVTTLNLQLDLMRRGFDPVPQRTSNLEAYDDLLRAIEDLIIASPSPSRLAQARKMAQTAVGLDPGYADAYSMLGFLNYMAYIFQWDSRRDLLDQAGALVNKAIALDDSISIAYSVRGWVAAANGQRDQAFADAEQAVSLDPNSALAWLARSDIYNTFDEKPEDALVYAQKARRLDPRHPETGCLQEGNAFMNLGRYSEAIDAEKLCEQNNPYSHVDLVFAYSELGRQQEARAEAAEVMRASPGFTLEKMKQGALRRDDPGTQHFFAMLRKAGLK